MNKLKILLVSAVIAITSAISSVSTAFAADETIPTTSVAGDVNGSGTFEIADVVTLQNWLLGRTTELADWKAADLCEDDKLDVFDLGLLKSRLLSQKS